MQGRAVGRTAKNFPSGCPFYINVQVKTEEKQALSEVWALQLADRISSIVVLKIVYFLASKNTEEPGTTALSKCLLPLPSLRGLGLTATSSLRNSRSVWCGNVSRTWKTLEFVGDEGKHQDLLVCGSEHTVLLCRKHLGTLEACPSTLLYLSAGSEGLALPSEDGCLERRVHEQATLMSKA